MVSSGQLGATRRCGRRGPPPCLGGSPACAGHRRRVPGGLEGENRILEAATGPPATGSGACGGCTVLGGHGEVRGVLICIPGESRPCLYGSGPGRVSIARLAEPPVTRTPAALRPPQGEERSDQIEAAGTTCGPRRPKGLVVGSQAHGGSPAAASRPRTPSYKFTTTKLRTLPPPHSSAPRAPFAETPSANQKLVGTDNSVAGPTTNVAA